jgi:hypothetical protein
MGCQVRAWGLSNETSWGVMQQCAAADAAGVPRPVTIQNHFSLLNRTFESELAEVRVCCGRLTTSAVGHSYHDEPSHYFHHP